MNFSKQAIVLLRNALEQSGFTANENFTAVDTMIYKDSPMAFIGMNNCQISAQTISPDGNKFYLETECEFEIKLMGKSGAFCDYNEFDNLSVDFYTKICEDENFLVKKLKMDRICQYMPLKRLQRNVILTVRILIAEDISQ